jgi:hypothetical protein
VPDSRERTSTALTTPVREWHAALAQRARKKRVKFTRAVISGLNGYINTANT